MWERPELVGSTTPAPSSILLAFAYSESTLVRNSLEGALLRPNARLAGGDRLDPFGACDRPRVTKYTGRMPASSDMPKRPLTIREAFPALPEGKEAEAEARLVRYVALVYKIYEHIREDPEKYAAFQQRLTEVTASDSMDSVPTSRAPSS